MNSRNKGKVGEREWANFLKAHGLPARRSEQYCGAAGDADVLCEALERFHQEVKRVERLDIHDAIQQARDDSNGVKTPIVAHRRNRTDWLVTMLASDWLKIVIGSGVDSDTQDMTLPSREGIQSEKSRCNSGLQGLRRFSGEYLHLG